MKRVTVKQRLRKVVIWGILIPYFGDLFFLVLRFAFDQCVHVFCNVYKSWQICSTKSSHLNFISCTYKIIAFFAECWLHYIYITKRARKTPVLERPINTLNDKRSELRFCSKSMFSTISCVRNLGSLKIRLFFLNELWYKLWLKIAITRFSNTRFTCKIISVCS